MRAIDRLLRNRPKAGGLSLLGKIRALFANGEQGWWYDPSDFNRYITPLGPELVTNGDFSGGTTGWSNSSTGSGTFSVSGGLASLSGTDASNRGITGQGFTTVVGRTYVLTFTASSVVGATLYGVSTSPGYSFNLGGGSVPSGTARFQFTATATTTYVNFAAAISTAGSFSIDNISVKELTALDTATLFQDSAGTTPVTAMEQPVGLQLDLSKGLVLGPELVTNGDFSNGTTGWFPSSATISVSSGELLLTNTGAVYGSFSRTITTVVGKTYSATATMRAGTATSTFLIARTAPTTGNIASVDTASTTNTTLKFYFTAVGTTTYIVGLNNNTSGGTAYFDNITVKELPGNHRFQTTSANRPVVSARVKLLTKTEEFNDAAWVKSAGATVTSNTTTAPNGTVTADTLVCSGGGDWIRQPTSIPSTAIRYTYSIYVKANLSTAFSITEAGATASAASFTLTGAGSIAIVNNGGAPSATISAQSNGWYLCSFSYTTNGSQTTLFLNNLSLSAFIWGADLRVTNVGVNLPAYQRVNTSTDYDSTGFPIYIKPNGSNQFMQTNSINFTATDKMTVWQGVRKLSDASAVLVELSAIIDSNNGSFTFSAPSSAGANSYRFNSKGTVIAFAGTGVFAAAPVTNVLTGLGEIATDFVSLRVNGSVNSTSSADQGTGNYGNYPAYFYARGGTSLYFSGNDYGSIARGAASTAAQITAGETYINSKTKAFV